MADNTVTLVLDGKVSLADFAKGVAGFSELVSALSDELSGSALNWIVDDLQFSSAIATARAEGSSSDIFRVVSAYADVGTTLEARKPLKYGQRVQRAAQKIVDISVERVRFETAISDSLIPLLAAPMQSISQAQASSLQLIRGRKAAYGGVKGRIQTLTSRGALRFTLFDTHQDKAVSCYFEDGKQDQVRDLWGRLAIVEGIITRDPVNGRPLNIRQVSAITPFSEPSGSRDFELARGAAPSLSGMTATQAIRKVRDAE